ncbi:hypothetical protein KCU78_g21557, partial [Aureobasidium melanogenum]
QYVARNASLSDCPDIYESKNMNLCKKAKRTAVGIPLWSPTRVLICRSTAYVWQSGRDAQFSADCGRTWWYA